MGRRMRCLEKQLHPARSSLFKWTDLKATRDWKLRIVGTEGFRTWNLIKPKRRVVAWNRQQFQMINSCFERRTKWNWIKTRT